jgi:ribosome-binding factor A
MSQRSEKVEAIVNKVVAAKLNELIREPYLTVTGVQISDDLQYATIWISVLDSSQADKAAELLEENRSELQKALSEYMSTKYTPRLSLRLDRGGAHAHRIDDLLKEL